MGSLAQQLEFECPTGGKRLDRMIAEQLQEHSRSEIQRWRALATAWWLAMWYT
jgi:hypothetical protein